MIKAFSVQLQDCRLHWIKRMSGSKKEWSLKCTWSGLLITRLEMKLEGMMTIYIGYFGSLRHYLLHSFVCGDLFRTYI